MRGAGGRAQGLPPLALVWWGMWLGCGHPHEQVWGCSCPLPPPPAGLGEVEAGQEVAERGQEEILVDMTGNDLTHGKVQHQPTAACL